MSDTNRDVGLARETRLFGISALVYLVPNVLLRGASFLLTPLYTRVMAPSDFAVVAIANSIAAVLGIVLGMGLPGCVPRLFFEYDLDKQRRFFGTLVVLSVVVPSIVLVLLSVLGSHGYLDLFENVRYSPHLRLVLWTSVLNVFIPLPSSVFMARERPRAVAALNAASGLSQLGFSVFFVAGLHQGAVGVLRANLLSAALVGLVSIGLMLRMSRFAWPLPGLGSALAFSLPLVPHLAANWALSISDRLVLDRYVPAADVGRYSLGYVFSMVVSLVAASVSNAMGPAANRQLKEPLQSKNVPPLGTYALAVTIAFALGVSVTAPEAIALLAPPTYAAAAPVVPWVVLGAVFQSVYFVWSTGTWFSMKTKLVPLITIVSAGSNIGLNLVFVPRYGVMAAAVSTAVSYAISAGLHGWLANKLHPIAWEYRRWAILFGVGATCYFAAFIVPIHGLIWSLTAKAVFVTTVFPSLLVAVGFLSPSERKLLRGLFVRVRGTMFSGP